MININTTKYEDLMDDFKRSNPVKFYKVIIHRYVDVDGVPIIRLYKTDNLFYVYRYKESDWTQVTFQEWEYMLGNIKYNTVEEISEKEVDKYMMMNELVK